MSLSHTTCTDNMHAQAHVHAHTEHAGSCRKIQKPHFHSLIWCLTSRRHKLAAQSGDSDLSL